VNTLPIEKPMPTIHADPYRWPCNGDLWPINTFSTRARATAPISPNFSPTSAGARARSAPASAMQVLDPRARRARLGDHSRAGARALQTGTEKPGNGSFCAIDLELLLRLKGVHNSVLAGSTTDVCVHTTMREANDCGLECRLLEDWCAATGAGHHAAAIKMIKMRGGVFGSVATSVALMEALP
jgi:Isochorismatase family